MDNRLQPNTGINFIPRYVHMPSDMEYGSIVTHEHYNEILNLNGSQGDYNTEILKLLLTNSNPEQVPHIKYLDNAIFGVYDEVDGMKEDITTALNNSSEALEKADTALNTVGEINQTILDIINGVQEVGKAVEAGKITGIDTAGIRKYYGTNNLGVAGFHSFPNFIYADDMSQSQEPTIDGIYYVPRANSIDETMLTDAVRTKLNRTGITDYNDLTSRPSINGVLLTGNKTLTQLGIQPAGSYLTSIPSEYITESELTTALNPYLTSSSASSTYATKTALNNLTTTVNNNATTANQTFARIFVGSVPSGVSPKTGDMLVTL